MSEFDDYPKEMNGFDEFADDRIEALLEGRAAEEEDLALTAFLAEVRSLKSRSVPSDLVQRQVAMLVEAKRLETSPAKTTPSPSEDAGPRVGKSRLWVPVRRALATKAAAVVFATLLLGGGVAAAASGSLPAPVQQAVARVAAQVGIQIPGPVVDPVDADLPDPGAAGEQITVEPQQVPELLGEERAELAQAYTEAVQEVVAEYTEALDSWAACVAANAAARGETQRDEETRTEGAFDPTEGCDPRPTLSVPDPVEFGLGGSPAVVTGQGRPEDAGPPEGVGPPEEVGPPEGVGPPEVPGLQKQVGRPSVVGRPGGPGDDDAEAEGGGDLEVDVDLDLVTGLDRIDGFRAFDGEEAIVDRIAEEDAGVASGDHDLDAGAAQRPDRMLTR